MDYPAHAFGDGDAAGDRAAVERTVRQGLDEIRAAISQLERTCRQGKITPGELAEERDLLEAQDQSLRRRID